jgi:hypothetical protein
MFVVREGGLRRIPPVWVIWSLVLSRSVFRRTSSHGRLVSNSLPVRTGILSLEHYITARQLELLKAAQRSAEVSPGLMKITAGGRTLSSRRPIAEGQERQTSRCEEVLVSLLGHRHVPGDGIGARQPKLGLGIVPTPQKRGAAVLRCGAKSSDGIFPIVKIQICRCSMVGARLRNRLFLCHTSNHA